MKLYEELGRIYVRCVLCDEKVFRKDMFDHAQKHIKEGRVKIETVPRLMTITVHDIEYEVIE